MCDFYFENNGNGDSGLGSMAMDILSSIKETPWNKEIIASWREVAVTENVNRLYNTNNE